MDRQIADKIGALLYKTTSEHPGPVSLTEIENFKRIINDEELNKFIDLDKERYNAHIEKLKKRAEGFQEKLSLGKQALDSLKEEPTDSSKISKAERRKFIGNLIKKREKKEEKNPPPEKSEDPPQTTQQKETIDLKAIEKERRAKLAASLAAKISQQQKQQKQNNKSEEIPPAIPASSDSLASPAPPQEREQEDLKLINDENDLNLDLDLNLEDGASLAEDAFVPPTNVNVNANASQNQEEQSPSNIEKNSTDSEELPSLDIEADEIAFFPTVSNTELSTQQMEAYSKQSRAILDSFPTSSDRDSPPQKNPKLPPPPEESRTQDTPPTQVQASSPPTASPQKEDPFKGEDPASLPSEDISRNIFPSEQEIDLEETSPEETSPEETSPEETSPEETSPEETSITQDRKLATAPQKTPPAAISLPSDDDALPLLDPEIGIGTISNDEEKNKAERSSLPIKSTLAVPPLVAEASPLPPPPPEQSTTEPPPSENEQEESPPLADAASTPPKSGSEPSSKVEDPSIQEANIDFANLDFDTPSLAEITANQPLADAATDKITESPIESPIESTQDGAGEEAATNESVAKVTPAISEEIDYDRAYRIIRTFNPDNQKIILKGISGEAAISHLDADEIATRVLAEEDEDTIANFVRNLVFEKAFHEEAIEQSSKEKKTVDHIYKKEKAAHFIRSLAAVAAILLFGIFLYTFGIDYARSQILYQRAHTQIKNQNPSTGEAYFDRAFAIRPSIPPTLRIAKLYYLQKFNLEAAEKKFLAALSVNTTDKASLQDYSQMLISARRFQDTENQIDLLKKTYGTKDTAIRELDGEYHIAWARFSDDPAQRQTRTDRALFIYSELMNERPRSATRNLYLSRILESYSLNNNFGRSISTYATLHNRNQQFVEARSFSTYMNSLIMTYQKDLNKLITLTNTQSNESSIAIKKRIGVTVENIENVQTKLALSVPTYLPFLYNNALWNLVTKQTDNALRTSSYALSIYKDFGSPYEFEPTLLYSLDGEIRHTLKDFSGARTSFENALSLYENVPYANYFLGKIILSLENNWESARYYFLKALANLSFHGRSIEKNDVIYRDLLYSIAYTHYAAYKDMSLELSIDPNYVPSRTRGITRASPTSPIRNALSFAQVPGTNPDDSLSPSQLRGDDIQEEDPPDYDARQVAIENALFYWNQLQNDPLLAEPYIVDYAIANTYLMIGRYPLAEAKILQAIDRIENDYQYYIKYNGRVNETILARIKILSDLYNNLGIAKAKQRYNNSGTSPNSNPYALKQVALENFINAISIKDTLKTIPGHPYANFNTLNYETREARGFLITDGFVPESIIP